MKKFLMLLVAAALCFVLVGCSSDKEDEVSESQRIYDALWSKAGFEVMWNYGSDNSVTNVKVSSQKETSENEFECHGYVLVQDAYGDKYKANFDAIVTIDEDGEASCDRFDMETPRRQ